MFSMTVSVDGFVTDRAGDIGFSTPSDEVFHAHLEEVASLGAYLLGRRLYEMMRVWETDPAMRGTQAHAAFADVWCDLPKVVFSRTIERVEGNARLATGSVAEEVAAALASTDRDVSIGGPDLAGQAMRLGLVDELRVFRAPVVVGGGLPYLPSLDDPQRFALVSARPFDNGIVLEHYRRNGTGSVTGTGR
ncbi:dihydrofolate reductase family protein [Oryzobacter telluris]|uniref:dihydrofolate reductase family protein n=1 Tax=Oryzobacter telluris TaxID=3149179 RepID=UPI00370D0A4B